MGIRLAEAGGHGLVCRHKRRECQLKSGASGNAAACCEMRATTMTAMRATPPTLSDLGQASPSVSARRGATDRVAFGRELGILVSKY